MREAIKPQQAWCDGTGVGNMWKENGLAMREEGGNPS